MKILWLTLIKVLKKEGIKLHPLFTWMKGTVTIAPGVDLTEPADPDWGDLAWGRGEKAGPR